MSTRQGAEKAEQAGAGARGPADLEAEAVRAREAEARQHVMAAESTRDEALERARADHQAAEARQRASAPATPSIARSWPQQRADAAEAARRDAVETAQRAELRAEAAEARIAEAE